jgi:large repetitive protein
VYEGERYDNATTIFDGKSNKGVSIMGTDLPDGTYFYIIDKRNGSKPLTGYLEIVN